MEQLSDLPEELISLTAIICLYIQEKNKAKTSALTNECDELHSHPKAFLMFLVTSHLVLVTSELLPCTPSIHLSAHRERTGEADGLPQCHCLHASPLFPETVLVLML